MAAGLLFIFYRENTEEKYMSEQNNMKIIARIHNDFQTKFGIPHQSNRLSALKATIVFEPEYRVTEAFRGLEDYDYIWLIWQFSEAVRENWSPTVRPPRLGGNTRACLRPDPHSAPTVWDSHQSAWKRLNIIRILVRSCTSQGRI